MAAYSVCTTTTSSWRKSSSTGVRNKMSRSGASNRLTLQVYEVGGRLVRTLAEGTEDPGQKTVAWDRRHHRGHTVASGVYFYRLTLETLTEIRKMLLMK